MKTQNILPTSLVCILLTLVTNASAQSWKDLVDKVKENATVENLVNEITGQNQSVDVCGTWTYTGPTFAIKSDNFLKDMANDLALDAIKKKLSPVLKEIGLKKGSFGFSFASDKTFNNNFKKTNLGGKYTLDAKSGDITLSYGKMLNLFKLKGIVERDGKTLELMFPAEKFIKFLQVIAPDADDSVFNGLESLIKSDKNLHIGFELTAN